MTIRQNSDEMTIVDFERPIPGGRQSGSTGYAGSCTEHVIPKFCNSQNGVSASRVLQSVNPALSGKYINTINPVLAASQPLLDEMVLLQRSVDPKDIYEYRDKLVYAIREFELQCSSHHINDEMVVYSRYVLCTALDEMANKTPWLRKGEWSRHSLLLQYHGETGGGEKFFDLLDYLSVHGSKYLHVLELMLVCLNLGFEGKYHLFQRGHTQLETIKENLFQMIRIQRGDSELQLSDRWHGITDKRNPLTRYIPVWVFLAVTSLFGIGIYGGFNYFLVENSDQVARDILNLPAAYSEITRNFGTQREI